MNIRRLAAEFGVVVAMSLVAGGFSVIHPSSEVIARNTNATDAMIDMVDEPRTKLAAGLTGVFAAVGVWALRREQGGRRSVLDNQRPTRRL